MTDITKRATAPNHDIVPPHLAWLPPARPDAPELIIPREGRPTVSLQLIDEYWIGVWCYLDIKIDGEPFTVENTAFLENTHDLPAEVRARLAGLLPDGGLDHFRRRATWHNITQRLISDRIVWMVATFMVTKFLGFEIEPGWVEEHERLREGGRQRGDGVAD